MPGKFHVASTAEASSENERVELLIETPEGFTLGLVQIAGRMARRIVCYPREGEPVRKGERFGLIRFGSRVELLPAPGGVRVRPARTERKGRGDGDGVFPMSARFRRRPSRQGRRLQRDDLKKGIYILPNLFTSAGLFAGFYSIVATLNAISRGPPGRSSSRASVTPPTGGSPADVHHEQVRRGI